MARFEMSVETYMASPVHTVRESTRLAEVDRRLREADISGMPVIDDHGHIKGVVTRTDLLRSGRVRPVEGGSGYLLHLPDARASEAMSGEPVVISLGDAMADAAHQMAKRHHHRVFVVQDGRPVGVLGSREIMRAVVHKRLATPLSEQMTSSVVTVNATDPLSLARDRLAATHVTGLIVVEGGWPVGVFAQADALAARDAAPGARVDEWMDPSMLSLPKPMPLFRAAAQCLATRARRILVMDEQELAGVVTPIDMASAIASSR